jgi:hypothetical protein
MPVNSQNDFTWAGFFTIVALFSNFWSCWSLFNVYVTMSHQEVSDLIVFFAE